MPSLFEHVEKALIIKLFFRLEIVGKILISGFRGGANDHFSDCLGDSLEQAVWNLELGTVPTLEEVLA